MMCVSAEKSFDGNIIDIYFLIVLSAIAEKIKVKPIDPTSRTTKYSAKRKKKKRFELRMQWISESYDYK